MPTYQVRGTKGEHTIQENAHSLTKAHWVGAMYVEHGYQVEIVEVTPLTSGSL